MQTKFQQQYLFTKLKIEPTSKVQVDYDKNESRLTKITKISEDTVQAPTFSILYINIHTTSSSSNFGTTHANDQIAEIRARYQEEPEISLDGSEDAILQAFCRYVLAKDPDILVSSNQHSRSTPILDYMFTKITKLGLDLQLGRDKQTNKTNKIKGRLCLGNMSFQSDLDLAGLIEKARFGFLPSYEVDVFELVDLILPVHGKSLLLLTKTAKLI